MSFETVPENSQHTSIWHTWMLYFSTYNQNLFKHLLTQAGQTVWETPLLLSLHQLSKQHIGQVYDVFSSTTLSCPQAKLLH